MAARTKLPNLIEAPLNRDVFLNVPYDEDSVELFVAYVAGLVALGLSPRASLEIPGGAARLDKVVGLIDHCAQSVHDLSRVELDLIDPPSPRFNMPFELGVVIGVHRKRKSGHTWFVFEANERRLKKSLSDLAEADPYIHHGTPRGVLGELLNAFVRSPRQPTMKEIGAVYDALMIATPDILAKAGSKSPFKARAFRELVLGARAFADEWIGPV